MAQSISLSPKLIQALHTMAQQWGISPEELCAMAVDDWLQKHQRSTPADWDFARKMNLARRGLDTYQEVLAALEQ